ncbi:MAG TPA: regulatory protein RecX [Gemmatimonadaceae bacterium]|jgi:regulatory protein
MKREVSTYDRALNLLAFRARSVSELRSALIRKGEPRANVEEAIVRLLEQRLLDDAAFAQQFARMRILGPGASRLRISQELRRRGVAMEVIDRAIEELQVDEGLDPSSGIQRVAEKKWRSMAKLDDFTRKRRLYAFLARRGFNPDEIRGAINAIGSAASA